MGIGTKAAPYRGSEVGEELYYTNKYAHKENLVGVSVMSIGLSYLLAKERC